MLSPKSILVLLLLVCAGVGMHAQSDRMTMRSPYAAIVNLTDFCLGVSPRQGPVYPLSLGVQTVMGYQVNQRFTFGLGLGWHSYGPGDANLLPIFLDGRVHFPQRHWTPFVALDAGYALCFDDSAGGGVLVNPNLGARIPIGDRLAWSVGLGYRWQGSEGIYDGQLAEFRPDYLDFKLGLVYKFDRLSRRFFKRTMPYMKDKSGKQGN